MSDRLAAVVSGVGDRQAQRPKSRVADRVDVSVVGDVGVNVQRIFLITSRA
jgi:hypothetical protein